MVTDRPSRAGRPRHLPTVGTACLVTVLALSTTACDRSAPTAGEFRPSGPAPTGSGGTRTPNPTGTPLQSMSARPSAGPASSASPVTAPSAITLPLPAGTSRVRRLTVAAARPAAASALRGLKTIRVQGPNGTTTGPEQLLDDGSYLAVRSEPPVMSQSGALGLGRQELGTVRNGVWKTLARNGTENAGTMKGSARQIIGAAMTSKHLAWVETPSTDLNYCEWSVRIRDMATGTTRQISHSPVLQGGRRILRVFGETRPFVVGDHVHWAANTPLTSRPDPAEPSDWRYELLQARTDGTGGTTVLARGAALPAVDSGSVYYATTTTAPERSFRIHRHRLSAGGPSSDTVVASGRLRGEAALTNLSAGQGRLVWTVSSPDAGQEWDANTDAPGHLFVMNTATRDVLDVTTADLALGNYSIAFGPDRVLWGNGSGNGDAGQYLLDLRTLRLHRLGRTQGFSTVLSAPGSARIMWGTACPGQGTGQICWRSARWAG
jgi:hypothetical protein